MRAMLVATAAIFAILLSVGSAQAQGAASPFCTSVDGLDVGVGNNGSTNNTATGATNGARTVRVTWTGASNGAGGFVRLNGTIVHTITAVSGSVDIAVPDGNGTLAFTFIAGPGGGQILFECVTSGGTVTIPTSSGADETGNAVDGSLADQSQDEEERVTDLMFDMWLYAHTFTDTPPDTREEYERRMAALLRSEAETAARLAEYRQRLEGASAEERTQLRSEYDDAFSQETFNRTERQLLEGSSYHSTAASQYAPQVLSAIDPPLAAIDGMTLKLPSLIPGWTFSVAVHGNMIDRTFAALNRRTTAGSLTLLGSTRLDPETTLGLGLKVGSATSVTNTPASTVNSTQIGADLAVLRLLSPDLFGGLYLGYEFGAHQATVAGVNSSFASQTLKVGGMLKGEIAAGDYTITPSVSTLLQHRNRAAFTDGAGVPIPGSTTTEFDLTGGAEISRMFVLPESGVTVTPFLGADLMLDYSGTNPTPTGTVIPTDTVKAALKGGVRIAWDSGAALNLEGRVTRGATTTAFGLSGAVTVPIN